MVMLENLYFLFLNYVPVARHVGATHLLGASALIVFLDLKFFPLCCLHVQGPFPSRWEL